MIDVSRTLTPLEVRELWKWGDECKLCRFIVCECPVYRLGDRLMLTRAVPSEEQRRDADAKYESSKKDGMSIVAWLQWRRDHAAADRQDAEARNDQVQWTVFNDECFMFNMAATEIELSRVRIALLTETSKSRPER